MTPFFVLFMSLCAVCAVLLIVQNRGLGSSTPTTPDFKKLQRMYLVVYVCAVMGDWLQGPYVYALYTLYLFTKQQIGFLFIVGFGSSMIFGTFTGTLADRYGRKLSCMVYCALYVVSCLTKHSPNFYVLLFGRFTGGIATSILFGSFEPWLVAEHNKNFYPSEWLNQTFQYATISNGVAAIIAGWLGSLVRDTFASLVAPFDTAIVFLVMAGVIIQLQWEENKGQATAISLDTTDNRSKFRVAMDTFKHDPKVMLLGWIQSCFESSMYIFVFMWTPKLEAVFTNLNHGQVFGCFMASLMIGSSCTKYIMMWQPSPARYMREVFIVGSVSLTLPAIIIVDKWMTLGCFCIFEVVCGLYWPAMGVIKSKYVPEEVRATVYNIFRIPLNLIVVIILSNLGVVSDNTVFVTCGMLLAAAAFLQHVFYQMVMKEEIKEGMAPNEANEELTTLTTEGGEEAPAR